MTELTWYEWIALTVMCIAIVYGVYHVIQGLIIGDKAIDSQDRRDMLIKADDHMLHWIASWAVAAIIFGIFF